jgi:hypothetical protein
MGGACLVRVTAYREVGGYDPEFFLGGEEETLGLQTGPGRLAHAVFPGSGHAPFPERR